MGGTGLTVGVIEARVERFSAMGTRVELHRFGAGEPDALAAARRAVEAVDDALTIHRPSPTTALNEQLSAGQPAAVDDPVLLDALVRAADAWRLAEGLFDPTVGANEGRGSWSALAIDSRAGRVETAHPTALDFGGFGKGYALDRACGVLRDAGVTSAFLSAGESSIAVIGGHPAGGAWPLAIPHPLVPDAWLIELELEDAALSVSSTAGRAAAAPGRAAMIRPTDGARITAPATAVAVDVTGGSAEALSTAILVADDASAQRLLAAGPARRYRYRFEDDRARSSPMSG